MNGFLTLVSVTLLSLCAFAASQAQSNSVCETLLTSYESICSSEDGAALPSVISHGLQGKRGAPGQKGEPGEPGRTGSSAEIDYEQVRQIIRRMDEENTDLGTIMHPATSCKEIKHLDDTSQNGLYFLQDLEGNVFRTYCDMITAGGGWSLVASVHENNLKGRCTAGDRWSSEQGFSTTRLHGDGFWENRATHGSASSASSDDYKNSGYFAMNATDIMVWQVPDDTPMTEFESSAFLKYHTRNGFMSTYGGNLASLFSRHYNLKAKQYRKYLDNGPAIPIAWDRGSNEELLRLYPTKVKNEVDAGYVQFRVINHESGAFALCPGVKMKSAKANAEHPCIGSTSFAGHLIYCGDFASRDHHDGWNLNSQLIDSVVMIFYR